MAEKAGYFPTFCSCRTHLSCDGSSPFDEIEHRQHGERAIGVLHQAAIASLGETPDALERQEWMLDLGADRRFTPIGFFIGVSQRAIPAGALVGEVASIGREFLEALPLFLTPVGAVTVQPGLLAAAERPE